MALPSARADNWVRSDSAGGLRRGSHDGGFGGLPKVKRELKPQVYTIYTENSRAYLVDAKTGAAEPAKPFSEAWFCDTESKVKHTMRTPEHRISCLYGLQQEEIAIARRSCATGHSGRNIVKNARSEYGASLRTIPKHYVQ